MTSPYKRYVQFPHLPEHLWEHVFSFLKLKEWAAASGACRAFNLLQPEKIDAYISTNPYEKSVNLSWVAAHWRRARTINLEFNLGGKRPDEDDEDEEEEEEEEVCLPLHLMAITAGLLPISAKNAISAPERLSLARCNFELM